MFHIRLALMTLAAEDEAVAAVVTPLTRQADKWKKMPQGWTDESRKKFWDSLTGDNKHKVTKCIKQMDGKVNDPGAFCAALADRVLGPEWRKKKKKPKKKVALLWRPLVGKGLEKAKRIFGYDDRDDRWYVYQPKILGKTVFLRDHGVRTLYVVGSDGHAYTLEGGEFTRPILQELVESAIAGDAGKYPRSGIRKNMRVRTANEVLNVTRRVDKKAAHDQTPNAIDGAAARFKDHLDLKINEHFRMARPAEVPPTLNLLHGKDFIRVVKADGGLTREAVAFIARSTGNVYLAASWDRPHPFVIANVTDTDSWRKMRMAFNKYIIKRRATQAVDKVWKERGKAACDRVAHRVLLAADMRKVLSQLFAGHQPYVKDWRKFLDSLTYYFPNWVTEWTQEGWLDLVSVTGQGGDWYEWQGPQIGGYGYRGNRGFDPPEYAESSIEVTEKVDLEVAATLNLRHWVREFQKQNRSNIVDAQGFARATADMINSQAGLKMLGKLLLAGFEYALKDPDLFDEWHEDIQDAARDAQPDSSWDVSYAVKPNRVSFKRPHFKIDGTGITVWVKGSAGLDVVEVSPPEYDPY